MVQSTTHQPRNGVSQVFSQGPCQVRGCLDNFCIRVTVGSQDLKAALKEPINLLAKPSKCEANVPIHATSPVHESTWDQAHPRWWHPWNTAWCHSSAVSNLSWSEATDEASKMVVVRHPRPTTFSTGSTFLSSIHDHIGPAFSCGCPPFRWYTPWGEREFVFLQLLDMSILRNMARRNTQSLTCCCSPGSLWAKAEGIEEVLNSNRGNETTFVQLNPISFPGIKTPKGMILRPYGPKNVARQVSAVHCIPKDIA